MLSPANLLEEKEINGRVEIFDMLEIRYLMKLSKVGDFRRIAHRQH